MVNHTDRSATSESGSVFVGVDFMQCGVSRLFKRISRAINQIKDVEHATRLAKPSCWLGLYIVELQNSFTN